MMTATTTRSAPRPWQLSAEALVLWKRFPRRPIPTTWMATGQDRAAVVARLLAPPFLAKDSQTRCNRKLSLLTVLDWLELQPGALDMNVSAVTDPATGRRYALAASRPDTDRSQGILALDLTNSPPDLLVEVPHPGSDRHTERLGLALFRALPGAALLIAGAHRRGAEGAADVAHQPDSMFHALATHLADRGATQLQLHCFHDDSLADHDIVVSAGAGTSNHHTEQLADALSNADFDVCRAWTQRCGSLEGRTNAQGRAAAVHGYPSLHLEINRSTREDHERSATLIHTIANRYRST